MGLEAILIAVLGALGAVVAAFFGGKRKGRREEQDRIVRDRLRTAEISKELNDEINSLSGADIDRRLAEWLRDK